jgi:hypothetical protein
VWCQQQHSEHRPHVTIPQMFMPADANDRAVVEQRSKEEGGTCLTFLPEHRGWTWCVPPRAEGSELSAAEWERYEQEVTGVFARFGLDYGADRAPR